MEIRQCTMNDADQKMDLSMYAFQFEPTPEERAERIKKFKPEENWGAFENGELQAQLTLLPLQTYIQGQLFSMGGIAGVATWPENRRQGLVDQLLRHTLKLMKDSGQSVSFLHPFYFPFYRKYGWEIYIEYKNYTIPTKLLPAKVQVEGTIKRINRDYSVLQPVYEAYASQYNGTLKREPEWWTNRTLMPENLKTAVYYNSAQQAEGYILYHVQNEEMTIKELVYLNETARKALWTFIANHDSMVKHVKLKAASDDMLPYQLHDPRIEQQIVPYFMARIVDVKAFLEQYPFEKGTAGSFTLQVDDPVAEWNQGNWQVQIDENGQARVTQQNGTFAETTANTEQTQEAIQLDIQALTVLLMGYKRPSELYRWEKITGSEQTIQLLEQRIGRRSTYLMDFF